MAKLAPVRVPKAEPLPIKLDLGCGINKRAGFIGVDSMKFDGVDIVWDLRKIPWSKPLPSSTKNVAQWKAFADNSVDEVHSSHFVEHLTGAERIKFFNELYRVMKVGASATIITPNWSHACAYGDPTHQWPPMSPWWPLYLNKEWRSTQAPHVGYDCNFNHGIAGSWDAALESRNPEYKQTAMQSQVNAWRDLIVTLTKL